MSVERPSRPRLLEEELPMEVASITDFCNTWARYEGVEEAFDGRELKDLIKRLYYKRMSEK